MVSVSEKKIIDFIIKSQQGELIQKEGSETQKTQNRRQDLQIQ